MAKAVEIKYDVNCKEPLFKAYPNLAYIYSGIIIPQSISPDKFARYIVYFYTKTSDIHKKPISFTEKKKEALAMFGLPISKADNSDFFKIEIQVATNFLRINCDVEMEMWISLKVRFSSMCEKIRDVKSDDTYKDVIDAANIAEKLQDTATKIQLLEMKLFGDIEGLAEHILLNNDNKAKTSHAEMYAI